MKQRDVLFISPFLILWLVFGLYLFLPSPTIPDLPNSIKSVEDGDTKQVPGVSAYYNNYSREQVLAFYKSVFSHSALANVPLPTYSLNHPPIYAKQRIRQEIKVWYFEELVHPFRESLYVAGWTPALAEASLGIKYSPLYLDQYDGNIYYQKTTIRIVPTSLLHRLVIYVLTTALLFGFYWLIKQLMSKRA